MFVKVKRVTCAPQPIITKYPPTGKGYECRWNTYYNIYQMSNVILAVLPRNMELSKMPLVKSIGKPQYLGIRISVDYCSTYSNHHGTSDLCFTISSHCFTS